MVEKIRKPQFFIYFLCSSSVKDILPHGNKMIQLMSFGHIIQQTRIYYESKSSNEN